MIKLRLQLKLDLHTDKFLFSFVLNTTHDLEGGEGGRGRRRKKKREERERSVRKEEKGREREEERWKKVVETK